MVTGPKMYQDKMVILTLHEIPCLVRKIRTFVYLGILGFLVFGDHGLEILLVLPPGQETRMIYNGSRSRAETIKIEPRVSRVPYHP